MTKLRTHGNVFCELCQKLALATFVGIFFLISYTQNTFADSASITVPSSVSISVDTNLQARTEVSKTIDISVNTDSPTGYKLFLSSDSAETSLVSTNGNPFKINSTSGTNNDLATQMNNQYGYNTETIDNKLYSYIPNLNNPVKIRSSFTQLTAADNFKFNLGFALRNNIPADTYQRKLIFTLISEGKATSTLVNGSELNKAFKKALGITDQSYFDDPLKQISTAGTFYPDLNLLVGKNKCNNKITPERTTLISTPDSDAPVYLGSYRDSYDAWDTFCIWSPATKIVFPEDISYMFAGLTGTTKEMGFIFRDDRDINMLDFSKTKNASHLFQKTLGYYSNQFKADGFTKYLSRAEVKNIESLYEDSGISAIEDTSFMSKAKNIANVFKNTKYLESADLSTWTISDMEDASSIFEGSMLKNIDLSNSTFENTENTQNMFKNSAATTINLSKATFNNVENASGMFENARASTISMPKATFAKTTDFSNMFKGATNTSTIDLSKITFSAATNLSGMFQDTSAEQLTLNNTNLAGNNITDMSFMFKNSKVKNIDLGSMKTGPLTSIVEMFKNTNNLETITLPSVFNTSNITDMSSLFENNSKLNTINNLANLDTTNVRNMSRMFASDFYLPMQNIIPNLRANKVEDTSYMFYGTRATSPVVFPATFNTENLTDMSYMFVGFTVPSLDISNFKLGNVTTMEGTFSSETKTTAVGPVTWPSGQINMPHLTTMRALFKFNTAQNQIVLPTFKTPALTDTSYMFYGIGKIDKIDNINSLDTANVTTMEGMFAYNDSSLMKGENVKFEFNTGKVKNMNSMFKNSYVNYLDLSSFDTRSLVTAVSTFDYTWIKILDLTNWDTRNLEDVTSMFSESTWLVTIYASESFVTTKVTASENIFYSVTYDLGSGAIENSITYARIGAPGTPGAFTKKS